MRLGDLDALRQEIERIYLKHFAKSREKFIQDTFKAIFKRIDHAPTIDAVPVVRCAKCVHYEMGVCLKIYSDGAVSKYAWQERKPDDFCSYGKRKDGEG